MDVRLVWSSTTCPVLAFLVTAAPAFALNLSGASAGAGLAGTDLALLYERPSLFKMSCRLRSPHSESNVLGSMSSITTSCRDPISYPWRVVESSSHLTMDSGAGSDLAFAPTARLVFYAFQSVLVRAVRAVPDGPVRLAPFPLHGRLQLRRFGVVFSPRRCRIKRGRGHACTKRRPRGMTSSPRTLAGFALQYAVHCTYAAFRGVK